MIFKITLIVLLLMVNSYSGDYCRVDNNGYEICGYTLSYCQSRVTSYGGTCIYKSEGNTQPSSTLTNQIIQNEYNSLEKDRELERERSRQNNPSKNLSDAFNSAIQMNYQEDQNEGVRLDNELKRIQIAEEKKRWWDSLSESEKQSHNNRVEIQNQKQEDKNMTKIIVLSVIGVLLVVLMVTADSP